MPRSTAKNANSRLAAVATLKLSRLSALAASAPLNVVLNQAYYLPVTVSNANKLALLDATLKYEPEKIRIETSDEEPIWEPGSFFPDPMIDVKFATNAGELGVFVQPNDPADPGVDGQGEIVRIKFTPIALGVTKIIWAADSGLYTPDEDSILARIDSIFTPLDLQANGNSPTVITLNVVAA